MNISSKMKNYIKYNLKKIICPLLFYSGYFNHKLNKMNDKAVILMYHRVTNDDQYVGVTRDVFEKQMKYIKENMNPVSIIDIVEWIKEGKSIPPRAVAITFDDGYEDNYTNAYPILKGLSIPTTIFLTVGHIETSKIFWWDKVREIIMKTARPGIDLREFDKFTNRETNGPSYIQLNTFQKTRDAIKTIITLFKTFENEKIHEATEYLKELLEVTDKDIEFPYMLTWAQIIEMSKNGIDFGAHTIEHPHLMKISADEAKKEIEVSKRILEDRSDKSVLGFAYPYGYNQFYNEKIKKIVIDAGFRYACTAKEETVSFNNDLYELPRVSMLNTQLPIAIRKILKVL